MLWGMLSLLSDLTYALSALNHLIFGVDVRIVPIVSGLHGVVSATSVSFPVVGVSPGHSCLVNQVVYHAANARENFAGFRCFQRHA